MALADFACADAADTDALVLERFHDAVEAAVLLAEQVRKRNTDILEGDLRRVGAKPAVLVEFGHGDAGRVALDDEQGNPAAALCAGIGTRGDDQDVAIDRIRDEHL